jgi:F0F1-type ATP synthase delta subunit
LKLGAVKIHCKLKIENYNRMDIQQLSSYLKTTTDTRELQHTLERLSDGLYRIDTSVEESLRRALPYEQALIINKLAAQNGTNMDDKPKVQEFFIKLSEQIQALPVVQITLAVRPNAALVTLIHDWFYRTYHKFIILDIVINPKIMAGSIVSANGKYYDYSLGKQTNQIMGKTQ